MKSALTEKEWWAKFIERFGVSAITELAGKAAIEAAGLEFAPETVLPERLDRVNGYAMAKGYAVWVEAARNAAPFDPAETSQLAVDRYNAYPTLRVAAEALLSAARTATNVSALGCVRTELVAAWQGVEAELARGPK